MKVYYHATPEKNVRSILADGLQPSADGLVYLAESAEDAVRFLWDEQSDIWIFAVHISDGDNRNVEETFDHSASFFKCRSYGHWGAILPEHLEAVGIYRK